MTMAAAYATFASGGVYCKPIAVISIKDRNGKPIDIPLSSTVDVEQPARTHVVEPDAADVRDLDDAQLCLAWRRSYVRLETERGAAARLAIVEQRQRYLDELQRRHGTAFQAWLESGARASGNPLPFLQHRSAPGAGDRVSDGQDPESPV